MLTDSIDGRFRHIAQAMSQIVLVCDSQGRIEYVNSQWEAYTGRPGADPLGSDPSLHPNDRDALQAAWAEARASGSTLSARFRLQDLHGGCRWFQMHLVPVREGVPERLRWYGTSTDIDDQVRASETLAKADRRQDIFLATLAHELRNPLAPIRNAAQVLRGPACSPGRAAWAVEVINRQVTAMGRLLDDLLEISRMTLGTLQLHKERIVVRGVVDAALELARPTLNERGHKVIVSGDALDDWLDADPLRLTQALGNLLDNAARYTEPGGTAELSAQRRDHGVELIVRDNGIGLATEDLERVFDMFTQVGSPQDRTEGGLGIGLALVRGVVERHGGHVTAHSAGKACGTVFRMFLPSLDAVAPAPRQFGAARSGGGSGSIDEAVALEVLIVDDNRDNADTLAELLQGAGHHVRVAYGGAEALESAALSPPDVALIDIAMPHLGGEEVARRFRAQPWGERNFLVAITGWGQPEDRLRTAASGFDRHLVKPVDPEQIVEMLADRSRLTRRG